MLPVGKLHKIKSQIVNISGFMGYMVSVTITQICHSGMEAAIDNIIVEGCGCAAIKLYLQ